MGEEMKCFRCPFSLKCLAGYPGNTWYCPGCNCLLVMTSVPTGTLINGTGWPQPTYSQFRCEKITEHQKLLNLWRAQNTKAFSLQHKQLFSKNPSVSVWKNNELTVLMQLCPACASYRPNPQPHCYVLGDKHERLVLKKASIRFRKEQRRWANHHKTSTIKLQSADIPCATTHTHSTILDEM